MVYAIAFAVLLIIALLWMTYQYAQESLEKDKAFQQLHEMANVASALQKELDIADKEIRETQEALIEALVTDGDIDDVADLFNELLSGSDSDGKLPD